METLKRIWQRLSAAQLTVISFGAVIMLGTLFLKLPISTTHGISFLDALFTATSATCVTGLIVVDTATAFTRFGQGVILVMIQVGGFGIMMLSTFILLVLGRRTPLSVSDATADSFLKLRRYSLWELVRASIVMTLAFESLGAVLILSNWINDFPLPEAIWHSVFHSVSAFCNAGFSTFTDSLVGRVDTPYVNVTFQALIVCGGLGFFVMVDIWEKISREADPAKRRVSFHTKIVLAMSAILILTGAAMIAALEWKHSLAPYDTTHKLLHAGFQSVTARTAGFNTLDIGRLSNAGILTLIILMFIGGAPGSSAGGVKVTTIGVIFIVVLSRLRGRVTASVFGRSISRVNLERALTLVLLAASLIILVTMALLILQLGGVSHAESRGMSLEYIFECVSAFGTVGLSMGVTGKLEPLSKVLVIMMMFAGRLGPLTLMVAMERKRGKAAYRYPEEQILIG